MTGAGLVLVYMLKAGDLKSGFSVQVDIEPDLEARKVSGRGAAHRLSRLLELAILRKARAEKGNTSPWE